MDTEMDLDMAVEMLKADMLSKIDKFKEHYKKGLETTDHYEEKNSEEEWKEQFDSYLTMIYEGE